MVPDDIEPKEPLCPRQFHKRHNICSIKQELGCRVYPALKESKGKFAAKQSGDVRLKGEKRLGFLGMDDALIKPVQ